MRKLNISTVEWCISRRARNLLAAVSVVAFAAVVTAVVAPTAAAQTTGQDCQVINRIQFENCLWLGDSGWRNVTLLQSDPEVGQLEGFASEGSVNLGDTISFYASTTQGTFTAEIYRLGYYQGLGARRMSPTGTFASANYHSQISTDDTQNRHLVEASNWPAFYSMIIPADWTSGVYIVRLESTGDGTHYQAYIPFVVRDDSRASDLLVQLPVNTYQAYNTWGGHSLYDSVTNAVSFNRPYVSYWGLGDYGAGDYRFVAFLEQQGYDATYITNVDSERLGSTLFTPYHKAWISVGHDEYWSWSMRYDVETLRNLGVHLAFFGANDSYWRMRYDVSPVTNQPYRTIVSYKERAFTADPYAIDADPTNDNLITTEWRITPPGVDIDLGSEDRLLGVSMPEGTEGGTSNSNQDVVLTQLPNGDPFSWVFNGIDFPPNAPDGPGTLRLSNLLSYEADSNTNLFPLSPWVTDFSVLAASPFLKDGVGQVSTSNMTIYQWNTDWVGTHPLVFATGTFSWSHGLTDMFSDGVNNYLNTAAVQLTKNVLCHFAGGNASPSAPACPASP